MDKILESSNIAADAVITIIKYGIDKAMNEFNGRKI